MSAARVAQCANEQPGCRPTAERRACRRHFEWFLREAFGVRVLSAEAFTVGLVQRGILSLRMG